MANFLGKLTHFLRKLFGSQQSSQPADESQRVLLCQRQSASPAIENQEMVPHRKMWWSKSMRH